MEIKIAGEICRIWWPFHSPDQRIDSQAVWSRDAIVPVFFGDCKISEKAIEPGGRMLLLHWVPKDQRLPAAVCKKLPDRRCAPERSRAFLSLSFLSLAASPASDYDSFCVLLRGKTQLVANPWFAPTVNDRMNLGARALDGDRRT